MNISLIRPIVTALALSLCASLSWAEQPTAKKTKPASSAPKAAATAKKSKAAAPRIEPVDINSASKDELKKLPGVGDAEADKIIAGRPYLSKAHLVTRNVITEGQYLALRERVVARQKDAKFLPEDRKGAKKDAKK